jgi:hypothetical protein
MASTFKHTSWGRTRGPKNLNGAPGAPVTVLANTNDLKGITATQQGYATENQRYLHVLLTDAHDTDPSAVALTIFGYCHAFQRWFEIPQSEAGGEGQNTANTASSFAVADSGRAPVDQVPSDREYRRYDIAGIDRVAFVHADPTEVEVFAACSTF